jgi:plasmid stabilization system protein ParE
MKLRYTDRAKSDLELAITWYENQRRGLGLEFLDCVEASVATITQMPLLFAERHRPFRRALTRRFPFSIFYTIEQDTIVVHAIFDNRQNPAKLP